MHRGSPRVPNPLNTFGYCSLMSSAVVVVAHTRLINCNDWIAGNPSRLVFRSSTMKTSSFDEFPSCVSCMVHCPATFSLWRAGPYSALEGWRSWTFCSLLKVSRLIAVTSAPVSSLNFTSRCCSIRTVAIQGWCWLSLTAFRNALSRVASFRPAFLLKHAAPKWPILPQS